MRLDGMTGPDFWHRELPKEIDLLLAGVPQNLDLPEDFEVQAPINRDLMYKTLVDMVDEYSVDLQGIEVYDTREVDGKLQGVARHFNIEQFTRDLERIQTVRGVARALVKIAGFYAPDYGKVDHPCHQWCKDWGRCPDIQRPALTSLIQHFCTAYGAEAASEDHYISSL